MIKIIQYTILSFCCACIFSACAHSKSAEELRFHQSFESEENLIRYIADITYSEDVTRLHYDYIWKTLANRSDDKGVDSAFKLALQNRTRESQLALIRVIEQKFIHDQTASAMDLVGDELSEHFRDFDWHENDYPGGPKGPNEKLADLSADSLDVIAPERRANRTRESVVFRHEANEEVWEYMTNQWRLIEGENKWMLNKHAAESFAEMRKAAKEDGVLLEIKSSHRLRKVAEANAARAGNPAAVASFSAHSLGLAVDFQMSQPGLEFSEVTTRPMSEVIRMRESPVHKWLHIRGREFGWYPYQNEPWHWEYNPPGFREIYWSEFPGGAPERPLE